MLLSRQLARLPALPGEGNGHLAQIVVDGVVGKETKRALAVAWVDSSLGLIPEGVIPDNGRTRDYVRNYLEVLVFTNLKSSYNDLMSEVKKLPGIKTNKN